MNSITPMQNNVNFTAKVYIDRLAHHPSKKRFENIAQILEQKTIKDSKYDIDIAQNTDYRNGKEVCGITFDFTDEGCVHENSAFVSDDYLEKLLKKSDEYIAKKIVKLFKIFKDYAKSTDMGNDFYTRIMKHDKTNDATNFEEKFYDALVDKCYNDAKDAASRDTVLKNFSIDA